MPTLAVIGMIPEIHPSFYCLFYGLRRAGWFMVVGISALRRVVMATTAVSMCRFEEEEYDRAMPVASAGDPKQTRDLLIDVRSRI